MKNEPAPFRPLTRSQKLFLTVPAFAGAITAPAFGSIIYFQVIPGNGNSGVLAPLFFDMNNGYIAPFYTAGMDFRLDMGSNYNTVLPRLSGLNGAQVAINSPFYAVKFSPGALIDSSSTFGSFGFLHFYSSGPWLAGDSGYAGLKFGSNYGWANITYDGTQTHLISFAYETSGAGIHAGDTGAVPEPAETAMLGALMAGSAAAFAARRKRQAAKQAA